MVFTPGESLLVLTDNREDLKTILLSTPADQLAELSFWRRDGEIVKWQLLIDLHMHPGGDSMIEWFECYGKNTEDSRGADLKTCVVKKDTPLEDLFPKGDDPTVTQGLLRWKVVTSEQNPEETLH